jgi:16S rRNA (cytosine967-C5)-methyltransferase
VTARDTARRVLARVSDGAYATLALSGELSRARLSPPDRALTTELVYGVLKRRSRLDHALAAYAPRGLDALDERVRDTLRLAAYQLLFLRIPAHAAVDDAVSAVKRVRGAKLAGFANALLRRLDREGEPAPPPETRLAARLMVLESAPSWLVDEALRRFSPVEAQQFLAALNLPAPLWLRANTLKTTRDEAMRAVAAARPDAVLRPSPAAPEAFAVEGAGDPAALPPFAEGLVTAQDVAAQLVARLVEPRPGEHILDACAGVGGKSTHLAALAADQARIDSADLSARKLDLGMDQAHRLGVASLHRIVCDLARPDAPLAAAYDRVLLDAPCSGLGVLRRHPEAKWRKTATEVRDDVRVLAELQSRILLALAPRVKPGGTLVYSVCTFTDAEGPEQLAAFLQRNPHFSVVGEPLRTWPHRDDADAFFAAKLMRAPLQQ